MSEMVRLRAIVHGRVQGVSFRYYTRQEAARLDVTGYAHNLRDGSVEVVAEGTRQNVSQLLAWLHKGPRMAFVEKVDTQWQTWDDEFQTFEVRF